MKTRSVVRKGIQTVNQYGIDKATNTVLFSQTDYNSVTTHLDDFNVIAASNGDYHTATYNSFDRVLSSYLEGTTSQKLDFGSFLFYLESSGSQGTNPTGRVNPSDLIAACYEEAIGKYYDQQRSTIDLSVDIAQAGQVRAMVRESLQLANYVLRHPTRVLKRAYADWRRAPRQLGGQWLAFQYGWKPLAQSIYDTAVKVMSSPPHLMKVKVRASQSRTFDDIQLGAENYSSRTFGRETAGCEIACSFTHRTDMTGLLSEFTSLNPVSLAWELTPYSFVVDWFVDVGGYIRNMESAVLAGSGFVSGYVTRTSKISSETQVFQNYELGSTSKYQSLKGTYDRRYKVRSPLANTPTPELPRFRMDLGSGRLLNAAALLSQHLR